MIIVFNEEDRRGLYERSKAGVVKNLRLANDVNCTDCINIEYVDTEDGKKDMLISKMSEEESEEYMKSHGDNPQYCFITKTVGLFGFKKFYSYMRFIFCDEYMVAILDSGAIRIDLDGQPVIASTGISEDEIVGGSSGVLYVNADSLLNLIRNYKKELQYFPYDFSIGCELTGQLIHGASSLSCRSINLYDISYGTATKKLAEIEAKEDARKVSYSSKKASSQVSLADDSDFDDYDDDDEVEEEDDDDEDGIDY